MATDIFNCEKRKNKIIEHNAIRNTYNELHSEIYTTEMTMDCKTEPTFIALNDKYNQLYVLTDSNELDYLEQYNINNNTLNIWM